MKSAIHFILPIGLLTLVACDNASPMKTRTLDVQKQLGLEVESKPVAGKSCALMPSVPPGTRSLISKVNSDITACTSVAPYSFSDRWTRDTLHVPATFAYGSPGECERLRAQYLNSQLPNKMYACWNPSSSVSMGYSDVDPNSPQRACANLFYLSYSQRQEKDWVCNGAPSLSGGDTRFLGTQLSSTGTVSGMSCAPMVGAEQYANDRASRLSRCAMITATWFTEPPGYKVKHAYVDSYSGVNTKTHSYTCDDITASYNKSNFDPLFLGTWRGDGDPAHLQQAQACAERARESCDAERAAYLAAQIGTGYVCWTPDALRRQDNQHPSDPNWGLTNVRVAGSDLSAPGRTTCKNLTSEFGADARYQSSFLCADYDEDGDGVLDADDSCFTVGALSSDPDRDGCDASEDNDDDNDHWSDAEEAACGSNASDSASLPLDTDGDGSCNALDGDDDDDGHSDSEEIACGSSPVDAAQVPHDVDEDGICDAVDPADGRLQAVYDELNRYLVDTLKSSLNDEEQQRTAALLADFQAHTDQFDAYRTNLITIFAFKFGGIQYPTFWGSDNIVSVRFSSDGSGLSANCIHLYDDDPAAGCPLSIRGAFLCAAGGHCSLEPR